MRKEKDFSDNLSAPGPGKPPGDFARKITEKISREMEEQMFGKELPLKSKEGRELSDELFAPGWGKLADNFGKEITEKLSREINEEKGGETEAVKRLQNEAYMIMKVLAGKEGEMLEFAKRKVHEYFLNKFDNGEQLGTLLLMRKLLDDYQKMKEAAIAKNDDALVKIIEGKISFLKGEIDFFSGMVK